MLTEAVRLQYLHTMQIPVWKLRRECFERPCYKANILCQGQLVGQLIAEWPATAHEKQVEQLLANIMKALGCTISAAQSVTQAPLLKGLGHASQLWMIFGRELTSYYQTMQPDLAWGEINKTDQGIMVATHSLISMFELPELKAHVWQHIKAVSNYLQEL